MAFYEEFEQFSVERIIAKKKVIDLCSSTQSAKFVAIDLLSACQRISLSPHLVRR